MAHFLPSPTPGTTIFRLNHFTKQSKHWVSYYFPNIPKLFPPQGTALAVPITWHSPQKQFIWLSIASPGLCSKIISKMCSSNAITSTFYVLDLTYFLFTTYYYHQETLLYKFINGTIYTLPPKHCKLYKGRAFAFLIHCCIPND